MAKIAIVDEDPQLLQISSGALSSLGHEVTFTTDKPEDVLDTLKKAPVKPDLIVIDHRMPERNGVQLAREIRAKFPAIKISIVTADPGVEAEVAGMENVFVKNKKRK
jgi:CheY-like chemotaxis protein